MFRVVIPGRLLNQFAETLQQLRRATALNDVTIEATGATPPPIPGRFELLDATPLFNILRSPPEIRRDLAQTNSTHFDPNFAVQ